MLAPNQIIDRLEAIEADLAERQNSYEEAATDRARCLRDWEKRVAIHSKTAKGASADVRKANALAAAIEQDDLFERLADAEARYDAHRVVVDRVLSARATIWQSIGKMMGRG